MVIIDYVNRNTAPSWRKKTKALIRKHKEPIILVSLVLLAALVGGY